MLYYKFRIGSKFPECFSGVALRNASPDWASGVVEWSGHSGVATPKCHSGLASGVEWWSGVATPEWSEWSYFEP